MLKNRDVLIWLNSIGISNRTISSLYNNLDDISDLWEMDRSQIEAMDIVRSSTLDRIFASRNISILEKLEESLHEHNIDVRTVEDESYPKKLMDIVDRPMVLYSKGKFIDDQLTIAMVGARKSTAYGKWACEKFAKELSNMGITIVSGLAQGIDTVAHKVALREGSNTIAVLGNGLDIVYPKNNRSLYKEIEEKGCIFSEFPMGTEPLAFNFPQRNRIISGLSLGIIVIEAKEKSGSLITAHQGLEQGKDVFAVPGNINSIYSGGTNKLIKDGASPLLKIEDIFEEIYELRNLINDKKKENIDYSNFSDDEIKVIEILKEEPTHSDIIALKTGYNISTIMGLLTGLELKGVITELSRNIFSLS